MEHEAVAWDLLGHVEHLVNTAIQRREHDRAYQQDGQVHMTFGDVEDLAMRPWSAATGPHGGLHVCKPGGWEASALRVLKPRLRHLTQQATALFQSCLDGKLAPWGRVLPDVDCAAAYRCLQ